MSFDVKSFMLDLLYPENVACISCGREAKLNKQGFCHDCAKYALCFYSAPRLELLDGYTAAYLYNAVTASPVKKLKYEGKKYLAKPLADEIVIPPLWETDVVVPVPLHYKRERRRGFNQSELIARCLSERLGLRLETNILARLRDTNSQVGLNLEERLKNLDGAFVAGDAAKNLKILLVDDVRTTGSTLTECARALRKAGASRVYGATVCFKDTQKQVTETPEF